LRRKRAADFWFSCRGGPVRRGGFTPPVVGSLYAITLVMN
jgi:hypothetical protein